MHCAVCGEWSLVVHAFVGGGGVVPACMGCGGVKGAVYQLRHTGHMRESVLRVPGLSITRIRGEETAAECRDRPSYNQQM